MKLPATLKPCEDAAAWLETQPDPQTAWLTCQRSGWMLWLLNELNYSDEKVLRLYACWCARETPLADGRRAWDLLTDARSRVVVEVSARFAVGAASLEELRSAESAAWSAAESAAWSAAESAARSAAWSAAWSAARSAAESAEREWQNKTLKSIIEESS